MSKEKLFSILERLTECIEGPWFVGDGTLLGIHRTGDLIEWDNDIDIYLLPGSKLNYKKLNVLKLEAENYYLNEKVYDTTYEHIKYNPWKEYNKAMRVVNAGLNRMDLVALCSMSYETNKIENEHTTPNIDVFYLKDIGDCYSVDNWEEYVCYYKTETVDLERLRFHGIDIYIPNILHRDNILKRQYGIGYMTPDSNFKYIKKKTRSLSI